MPPYELASNYFPGPRLRFFFGDGRPLAVIPTGLLRGLQMPLGAWIRDRLSVLVVLREDDTLIINKRYDDNAQLDNSGLDCAVAEVMQRKGEDARFAVSVLQADHKWQANSQYSQQCAYGLELLDGACNPKLSAFFSGKFWKKTFAKLPKNGADPATLEGPSLRERLVKEDGGGCAVTRVPAEFCVVVHLVPPIFRRIQLKYGRSASLDECLNAVDGGLLLTSALQKAYHRLEVGFFVQDRIVHYHNFGRPVEGAEHGQVFSRYMNPELAQWHYDQVTKARLRGW